MKTEYDALPQWMKADGFSWDEIMEELRADNPVTPSPSNQAKPGCKLRTQPQPISTMESCGTIVFL